MEQNETLFRGKRPRTGPDGHPVFAGCGEAALTSTPVRRGKIEIGVLTLDSCPLRESRGETPLWTGVWGLCPQLPKGGRVGTKDIYPIGTMLVEKTSASLNSCLPSRGVPQLRQPCYNPRWPARMA